MSPPSPSSVAADFDHERFRAGDHALFREMVRSMSPRLMGVIRGYARDDDHAEDLLQMCWLRIYRMRRRFSGTGSLLGWLLAVSRNVCRGQLRGARVPRRVRLEGHGEIADPAPGPAERIESRLRAAALYTALERLTVRERDAIILRLIEGRSTASVARRLGVKQVSVRSLIHRGLNKLRRMDDLAALIRDDGGQVP